MMRPGFFPTLALAGLMTAVLAHLAPAAEPAAPKKVATVEGITEHQLDNGLRLLLLPDPSTAKFTVNQCVLVGSRMEGYGEAGMAHLLEHMNFKGTPNHPQVPKDLHDHGASFNATTSLDRTNYFETLNASDENLDFALNLESDRLIHSLIRHEDLATEMTVVRNEFEIGENTPGAMLNQRMMSAAYQWHNYSKSTIGNRSDIERVPIENLQAFYHQWYQPDNVVLMICGNFNSDKALALVTKYYAGIPRPKRALPSTWTEEPPQDGDKNVVLRRVGRVGMAGLMYHIPAASHPDFAPLEVLASLLSVEPSGVLYKAVVEAKKGSSVRSFAEPLHDPGVFEATAEVDKGSTPEAVRDVLIDVMENLGKTPPAAEEVQRAKTRLARQSELAQADASGMYRVLNEWQARGDWRLFFLHRDAVANVTPADVSRVALKYFVRSNRTAGIYLPTDKPDRAYVPETPDIAKLVQGYKGKDVVASGEFFDPSAENIQKSTTYGELSTGVKTAVLPKKTRGELASFQLTLHYGNADSLKGLTAAAQFLGPMMGRGTKKHTYQEIQDLLDKLNARISTGGGGPARGGRRGGGGGAGGAAGEITFSVECKRESIPAVMTLLQEIVREPAFPAEDFEVMKRRRLDGIEQGRTEPAVLAALALQQKLHPYPKDDIRYSPTIDESIERLQAVTIDQVRRLYEDQVGGTAGEFVAVGDFDTAPVLKQVDDMLKGWQAKTPYKRIERPYIEGAKGERIVIETPDKANAIYLAQLTFPLSRTDPVDPALELADSIFGNNTLSSRLGVRARQNEGLTYGITSRYSAPWLDNSASLSINSNCNPKNIDKVDAAVLDETDKMIKSGVSDTEAEEAKAAFLAARKVGRGSDAFIAGQLGGLLAVGRTFANEVELEKKVSTLTATQIAEAFKRYVDPSKFVIVEAGDFKKNAAPEK